MFMASSLNIEILNKINWIDMRAAATAAVWIFMRLMGVCAINK
jgi:hypothetical protein